MAAQQSNQLADVQSALREIVARGETQTARTSRLVQRGEQKTVEQNVEKAIERRNVDVFDRGPRPDTPRVTAPPSSSTPGATPSTPATTAPATTATATTAPATTATTAPATRAPAPANAASAPAPTTTTPAAATSPPPSSEQVQRALQNLQQQAGLPVTGRFDDATTQMLRNLGVLTPPSKSATGPATSAPATPGEPKVDKKPVDPSQQAAVRQRNTSAEQQLRSKVQLQLSARGIDDGRRADARAAGDASSDSKPVDRMLDPARLLASLFAAGFTGAGTEAALTAFQNAQKLPPTGQLDPRTVDALVTAGHLPAAAADAHHDAAPANATSMPPSTATSTGAAADKARVDHHRAQAAPTKTADPHAGDVVLRAQASSPEEARERARIESLLAQAAAQERGVQQSKGDPIAVVGHGQQAGAAAGLSGRGGTKGGANEDGDEGAVSADDGSRGDESSNANATSGDDDHDDGDRGDAVDALGDPIDDDGVLPDGHYRVPRLGEQVRAALDVVFRIDDGSVPVHYMWDVSLFRPGVYVDGQAAELIWHLVVDRAHAFDPVWQRAVDAIGARLLYLDPDAEPPRHDELLAALRRARVR
jgi:hypothetical protein